MPDNKVIKVIGAGLAGCEAAWQLAQKGYSVQLYEMRPQKGSPAHQSENFAELVCSNSLKSDRPDNASGLLKLEMRRLGSLLLPMADGCRVPAGGALAVDRDAFSQSVTKALAQHPNVQIIREEVTQIPEGPVIIATGPLTSDALSEAISQLVGREMLSFFDAAAPIVTAESLDDTKVFRASRHGQGDDYLNCAMNKEEYEAFYQALVTAQAVQLHGFENDKVFEGCMPVEVMASRGFDALRYGPMRPIGLTDPRTGRRPFAVVQLRQENAAGTLYNLVGFQTHLKFGEQKRVFGLIPGLENAEYARYGVMHRNTFLRAPGLLSPHFGMRAQPRIAFAGQMTGVEGYMESAASGIIAARGMMAHLEGRSLTTLPPETMIGALCAHVSNDFTRDYQPMNSNFGIIPALPDAPKDKKQRYARLTERGLAMLEQWCIVNAQ